MTSKVKAAILDEPTLKSAEINVETFKGVVQLSGFVSSQDAEKGRRSDASVGGVKSVKNDMRAQVSSDTCREQGPQSTARLRHFTGGLRSLAVAPPNTTYVLSRSGIHPMSTDKRWGFPPRHRNQRRSRPRRSRYEIAAQAKPRPAIICSTRRTSRP